MNNRPTKEQMAQWERYAHEDIMLREHATRRDGPPGYMDECRQSEQIVRLVAYIRELEEKLRKPDKPKGRTVMDALKAAVPKGRKRRR